ncbi:MAG: LemA family protein [Actinomycetota bacterium]|nr:LemA family protein [Actinomycetota bacterium]
MAVWAIVLIVVGALFVLYAVMTYNRLVTLKNRVKEAWAQIDVQLRRRYDLIPNLVNTVKGYAEHERAIFEKVAEARSAAIAAKGVPEQAQAENQITQALRQLFAVVENYPNLKANENFLSLQEELTGTEGRIAFARQFYNDQVRSWNTLIQQFPPVVIARLRGDTPEEYFEVEEAATGPVQVQF